MSTWVSVHTPQTWGTLDGGRMVWSCRCTCGWRSPNLPYEGDADLAGLEHNDGAGYEIDDSS